ncbi:MAG TPA: hypothetical protein VM364_12435 [Vicinamibacterales bacterium]|nr:hypothetical protein [Vicinamibacterales bacterium]
MTRLAATSLLRTLLVATLALVPAAAAAQTAGAPPRSASEEVEILELVLRDGTRAFGSVEREDDREIVFRTYAGAVITVQRQDVVMLRRTRGRVEGGTFVRADSHRSRLFFAPTARSLERGQVSVGVFEFLAPFVQVGVTDRFSVGGGTPLVFGIDEKYRPFWITPKLQVYDGGNAQAAVGVLQLFNVSGDSGGIAYGVGTFGSSDNAVTIGTGLAYTGDSTGGVLMVGGERRVRPNLKLITENYVWKGGHGIVSGGVRFLGERLSADLALAVPIGTDDYIAFPVVNFVYVFGR